MRIVFTSYAICSAGVCFVLTMALMICNENSNEFEKIVDWIVEFMYFIFGPVLAVFCTMGMYKLPRVT